jgi:hypothetical protein
VTASRELVTAAAAAAAILLFNAAYVSSQVGFLHSAKDVAEFDHHIYRSLAQSPPGSPEPPGHRNAPFVWRVATPWLAYSLHRAGLSIDVASYVVTNVALFGFLVVLYGLLRRRGFQREEALLGLVLVGLIQGAIRWYEYQYWMADPVALFLIALSLWLVETGRAGWLVAVGAVGLAARESYLLVFAFLFVRTLRSEGLVPAVGRPRGQANGGDLVSAAAGAGLDPAARRHHRALHGPRHGGLGHRGATANALHRSTLLGRRGDIRGGVPASSPVPGRAVAGLALPPRGRRHGRDRLRIAGDRDQHGSHPGLRPARTDPGGSGSVATVLSAHRRRLLAGGCHLHRVPAVLLHPDPVHGHAGRQHPAASQLVGDAGDGRLLARS